MANSPFVYGLPSEVVTPTYTLTSANATYPATNAGDWTDALIPFPALSTATTDDLIGDLGSAQRVDTVVIQHNWDASLAGLAFSMHASNSWGSPTVNTALVAPAKRLKGYTRKIYIDVTAISGYTTSGLRWLRIHMGTANSVPVGLKVLCYSRKRQLNRNVKFGLRVQRPQRGTEHTTDGGATWAYPQPSGARVLVGTVEPSDSASSSLVDWFEDSGGEITAIAAVDPLLPLEAHVVRLRSSGASGLLNASGSQVTLLDVQRRPGGFYNFNPTQITAEEVSSGLPEWT